ncbi:MAG TPA: hypothetical protein VGP37_10295 [Candidatus Nanopelagicales bacterium]|nr:hypothetical protein [Candidatus Nanopelagicales bacterium]
MPSVGSSIAGLTATFLAEREGFAADAAAFFVDAGGADFFAAEAFPVAALLAVDFFAGAFFAAAFFAAVFFAGAFVAVDFFT